MPVGAVIGGASIIGGGISAYGAYKASKEQSKAAGLAADAIRDSSGQQLSLYNQSRGDQQPYMEAGKGAVMSLAQLYGLNGANGGQPYGPESVEAFKRSPDYDFAFKEGLRATNFGAAGKGMLKSGNAIRGAIDYGQGAATQNFGNYHNHLMELARLGQGSAGQLTAAGAATGGQLGQSAGALSQAIMGKGAADASGWVGGTNAINGAIGGASNNLMLYNLLNNKGGSVYGAAGGAGKNGGYGDLTGGAPAGWY